ncbi:MAG: hypothetical protein IIA87_01540 [Nanoarchaeota archaeon]|nr:hypothetical protein [Nanoarchaeota archaeon]
MGILFLCKSNVFRSQMAEAFFNKYSKNSKAESAALIKSQDKMHKFVVRAMKEKGIDISKNISKKVTTKMINKADLIILIDPELKESFHINKKVEVWNIPDVVAKETDEYLYSEFIKARDIIEKKVRELITKIDR